MGFKDVNQFLTLVKKIDKVGENAWKTTTAKRITLTIPEGFQVYDTDLNTWFHGDGSTVGGIEIMSAGGNISSTLKIDGSDISNESAIRVGDWVTGGASGSGVVFTSGMDLYSDGQLDIVAVFGECSSDLTSAYSAKCGRFRHILSFGTDTVVNQETYGLIGQMVVKNGSLNHYHAGLMGTLETSTDCDIQTGYGVGCVSARFGGTGLTVESGGLMAGFLSILNASTFTATGNMAAFATKKTAGASTATWPIGIYMQPSSVSRILDAGTSSDKVICDTASTKFISIYTDCGALSGTAIAEYLRLYVTGTGGSGQALRAFCTVENVTGINAYGAHISLNFGDSGKVSGSGQALTTTLHIPNTATQSGTLSAITTEINTDGSTSDPSGASLSCIRMSQMGDAKDDVDDDCVAINFDSGWTIADGNMIAQDGSPTTTPNAVYSVKCRMPDGALAYLYLGTDALTA
jgi:hypothetical protein